MKGFRTAIVCSMAFWIATVCFAQSIEDVEVKPYGSYAGSKIDTVDLYSGNLFLDIPLISYPQRGKLPPLTFSIGLNNAPYTLNIYCDANDYCSQVPRACFINRFGLKLWTFAVGG